MGKKEYTRILVTGASGFIGGHLAEELGKRGYTVRALFRRSVPPAHLSRIQGDRIELMRADLTEEAQVATAVEGIDAVMHVAAKAGDWGPLKEYERHNYNATVQLLEAARRAGCLKFVLTSSTAVHGFGHHLNTTENGPYYPLIAPYQITKKRAEEYAISQNGKGIAVAVIRPGNVLGPGDTTTTFPILDGMERGLMGYISGGKSLTCPVYVDDVVDAHIRALELSEADGKVFNVTGGERVTWKQYVEEAAKHLGIRAPRKSLPGPVAYALAGLLETVYRWTAIKKAPLITRYLVAQLMDDYNFSIDRAKAVLGYEPKTAWQEALRRTVEDYRLHDGVLRHR